jgi:hypothetical protein
METIQGLLDEVGQGSFFGANTGALGVILAINLLLTLVHSLEELFGRLWRYFGAKEGFRIPDLGGFLFFFVVLTLLLWTVGFAGITGRLPFSNNPLNPLVSTAAVGAIIGARLSDTWYSHVRLHLLGYRPNPGLPSTPLYVAEAVLLAAVLFAPLQIHWVGAVLGFLGGWVPFALIQPLIRFLRGKLPALSQDKWVPGTPIPPEAM